jgi:hypothetical protein
LASYSKDHGARSISIGPAIAATSVKENANTTPKNSGAATGAGDDFAYIPEAGPGYEYPPQVAWDVRNTGTGTFTTLVVNLEVSDDDGTTWYTLDTNNSTTLPYRKVVANTVGRRFRLNIGTFTVATGSPVLEGGITC